MGREAVELAASGHVGVHLALWFVGLLKVAGGLLALALAQPWGQRRFPRWMLLLAGWGATALLILYGGAQIGVQLLVMSGAIRTPADMDWRGFYGHLYLWDPWFVLWGALLGITTFCYTRRTRRRPSPGPPATRLGPTAAPTGSVPSATSIEAWRPPAPPAGARCVGSRRPRPVGWSWTARARRPARR